MKVIMECVGSRKKDDKTIQFSFRCLPNQNPSNIGKDEWFQDGSVYIDRSIDSLPYDTGKPYVMELEVSVP